MLNKYYNHPIVHNYMYKLSVTILRLTPLYYLNPKDYSANIHALIDAAKVDYCNCIETMATSTYNNIHGLKF